MKPVRIIPTGERPSVLGGFVVRSLAFIPAFDFSPAGAGLVGVSDGHRDIEEEIGNVRKGVGEIQHVDRDS